MPMNPEVKARWVAALRSGKYAQGVSYLRSQHGPRFCCLGVLCDLYDPSKWDGVRYDRYALVRPPISVMSWSGLTMRAGVHLSEMNDGTGTPRQDFSEIADYIEREL
jgi:hypothetical protein